MKKHQRGLFSENLVKDYLIKKGFQLKAQRKSFFKCEVDLLFFFKNKLYIVEVKSVANSHSDLNLIIKANQIYQVQKVATLLSEEHKTTVFFWIALVRRNQQIHFITQAKDWHIFPKKSRI